MNKIFFSLTIIFFSIEFSYSMTFDDFSFHYTKCTDQINGIRSEFLQEYDLSFVNGKYYFNFHDPSGEINPNVRKWEILVDLKNEYMKIDATREGASEWGHIIEVKAFHNNNDIFIGYSINTWNDYENTENIELFIFKIDNKGNYINVTNNVLPNIQLNNFYKKMRSDHPDIIRYYQYSSNKINISYRLPRYGTTIISEIYLNLENSWSDLNDPITKERVSFIKKLEINMDYNTLYYGWDKVKSNFLIIKRTKETRLFKKVKLRIKMNE
jgi:hypothetical protein